MRRRVGSQLSGSQGNGERVSVLEAVDADLERFAALAPEVAVSAEAAVARSLAQEMDSDSSATSKSMCAGKLLEALEILRSRLPEKVEVSAVDDIAARRAKRLAVRRSAS